MNDYHRLVLEQFSNECPFNQNQANYLPIRLLRQFHTAPIVAYQAGAYPGFYSMKRLEVFLLPPPDGKLIHCRVTPQH